MKKLKAFTLAEIIITMGIVGVIAALTVPDLVNDYQNKAMALKIRKFSVELNEAVELYLTDKGKSSLSATGIYTNVTDFFNNTYFSIAKPCATAAGCFASENYYSMDQTKNSSFSCDGGAYMLSSSVTICPVVEIKTKPPLRPGGVALLLPPSLVLYVDINGQDPPNIGGRDMFKLKISDNGEVCGDIEKSATGPSLVGSVYCKESPLGVSCFDRLKKNNYKMDSNYY